MLLFARRSLAVFLAMPSLSGCGSGNEFTSDVAGNYTIAVTNGPSTCDFMNWEEGAQAPNIPFTITRPGASEDLHGTVDGIVGGWFVLAFGSNEFDGTISGSSFKLINFGRSAPPQGNCSYSYNATVDGTQTGDNIAGTITYSTKTNGNPDCEAIECAASQKFNGTRPPS